MTLWQDFQTNDQKLIHIWEHYFPIYEKLFANTLLNVARMLGFRGVSEMLVDFFPLFSSSTSHSSSSVGNRNSLRIKAFSRTCGNWRP